MPFSKKYSSVPSEASDDSDANSSPVTPVKDLCKRWSRLGPLLIILVMVSFTFNIFTFCQWRILSQNVKRAGHSQHADLTYNVLTTFRHESAFAQTDRTLQDEAWTSDDIAPHKLVVALEDAYTEPLAIPHSMRWPWDKTKGVYIPQAAHELHCLHVLREVINSAEDGTESRWPYGHRIHCLEMLLQSVKCFADDTLLYTGHLHDSVQRAVAGEGSQRICRDWNRLHSWADSHSACYNYSLARGDTEIPQLERYKLCPDGSRPWENTNAGS